MAIKTKKRLKKKEKRPGVTIVKNMRDYSQEPFFKKKLEDMKAFIEKNGLPEDFEKRSKK